MPKGMTVDKIISQLESEGVGIESVPITAGTSFGGPPIRSLYISVAGNVQFTSITGIQDSWPVPDNYTIPIAMISVDAYDGSGVLKGIR